MMLLRILLLFFLPASALAQDCDCCKIRTLGQQKYDAGDYFGAKSTWETAKTMPDSAKCADLDSLIAKTQKIGSPVTHGKKSGLTMIPVAGGTYTMGSPSNEANRNNDECQHSVTVDNFAIGQYEVTQADWKEVMGTTPANFKNCDECPVEQVSWNDVQEFIKAANQKYGRKYRLPTEAEWEYATRGGKKSLGYLYSGGQSLKEVAWCSSNSDNHTHEVGTKKANELGLYDMTGNVWEWCSDEWGPYPGCTEPKEGDSKRRVLRGGSWYGNDNSCRVAIRGRSEDSSRNSRYGFRLAQD
jgi:sulfatase modifying factor 1